MTPAEEELHNPPPSKLSLEELTYLLSAEHYVAGDFDAAAKQLNAIPSADRTAALTFFMARPTSACLRRRKQL